MPKPKKARGMRLSPGDIIVLTNVWKNIQKSAPRGQVVNSFVERVFYRITKRDQENRGAE